MVVPVCCFPAAGMGISDGASGTCSAVITWGKYSIQPTPGLSEKTVRSVWQVGKTETLYGQITSTMIRTISLTEYALSNC